MENNRRRSVLIILLAWLAYLISYLGRSDYSACLLEILNDTGASRATAGMVSSVFAICNAFGQLGAAALMRKVSPLKMITTELFVVCGINLLFPLTDSFVIMAILWGINGVMQATLLCSATQIFANSLKEPYLSRGVVLLNTIGAVAGMFNYVLSFVLIRWLCWEAVFLTVATLLMILGIVWAIAMPRLTGTITRRPEAKSDSSGKKSLGAVLRSYGAIYVVLGAFFIGGLRESVSLWIPTYVNETFLLSPAVATVITAVVPCLQACGAFAGGSLGRRSKTLQIPAAMAFAVSISCLLLIRLLGSFSTAVTIALFACNAISMTAALTFLLSLFPVRYAGRANIAMLVGVINFSVHAGDFAAAFGIGSISQKFGWDAAFATLCAAALAGLALCVVGGIACRREERNEETGVCS